MHFPTQLTVIDGALTHTIHGVGWERAAAHYHLPVRARARRLNTYLYTAIGPVSHDHEELAALERQAEELLRIAVANLGRDWEEEILPEVKRHLAFWEHFDLAGAANEQLLAHLDETMLRLDRLWTLHFTLAFPMVLSAGMFEDTYRELMGGDGAFDALELIRGFDNWSLRNDRALWALSRRALQMSSVRQILQTEAAADVIPALRGSAEGRLFLADLHAYLEEYGHRAELWLLSRPSMLEDPTPIIKTFKDYITQPDRDPEAQLAALAERREARLAEIRATLANYPHQAIEQFEFMLRAAQTAAVLSEDHNYWIDFRGTYEVRRVLLEVGQRLTGAGAIDSPDDIFHLTLDEIRETLSTLGASDMPRRQALVAERKAELERFRAVRPPAVIGSYPPGPPPDNPFTRAINRFFGAPPRPSDEPSVLNGTPGSAGVTRGPAKVVRSLTEAAKIEPGDVLVAETTAPPWTPLFATVAAIVTDTGGILSHCALVAREYQIPAVVGTEMATNVIRDGQLFEVNGDAGVVRLL